MRSWSCVLYDKDPRQPERTGPLLLVALTEIVCLSQMSRESFDYNLSQMRYITSLTMLNECRCFHAGAQRVTEWFNENKMMRITCCGHYSRTELGPIKHLCESDRPDSAPRHRHPKQQMREFLRHLDACGSFIYFNECLIS